MGLNDLAVKLGILEERMSALEGDILRELTERKEAQKEIKSAIDSIQKKVWMATGFLIAVNVVLQIALHTAFK